MEAARLSISNLHKSFSTPVLKDVELSVARGEIRAIVGENGAGKSTLVNALVQQKISIVTSKPQTTRHSILGILHRPDAQMIFVDTPGIHSGSRKLINRAMNRTAAASLAGADVALFVVEATR